MRFRAIAKNMWESSGFASLECGLVAAIVAVVAVPPLSAAGWSLDGIAGAVSAVWHSATG